MTMLPLNDYASRAHRMARDKGWFDTHRSFAALTLLMVSEEIEALEDYRDDRRYDEIYFEVKRDGAKVFLTEAEFTARSDAAKIAECKPCGIPIELADFVIRVADFADFAGINLEEATLRLSPEEDEYDPADFESVLAVSITHVTDAFNWHHRFKMAFDEMGHDDVEDFWYGVPISLAESIRPIELFCDAHGIDLRRAIEVKMAFNATRPRRHGGKVI